MRIDIMTLFPDMCNAVLSESIIGRARQGGKVEINCVDIRNYTLDKHRRVDDKPYGGGMGMIMAPQPIFDCYKAISENIGEKPHLIYLTPQGKTLTQQRVKELSKLDNLVLLCGHYEGIDERVIEELKSSNYMVRSMGERMALNTPVQGSASDILKKAMVEINNIFEKENIKSKMLLQVHDELIFNVYNDEIDKVKDIVYNTMTKVFELKVPLDVDIELGNNWYEAK